MSTSVIVSGSVLKCLEQSLDLLHLGSWLLSPDSEGLSRFRWERFAFSTAGTGHFVREVMALRPQTGVSKMLHTLRPPPKCLFSPNLLSPSFQVLHGDGQSTSHFSMRQKPLVSFHSINWECYVYVRMSSGVWRCLEPLNPLR